MAGSNPTIKRSKRATLADVAARAGVSVATASVAITGRRSGNCRVSVAVAENIRRTAQALKYRPNIQARNLSTQRTHTVALVVKRSNWQNAMFFLSAAQRVLRQRGFSEIFLLHPQDEVDYERQQLEMCIDARVEGIIIMPLIDRQRRTNFELLNRIHQEEEIPIVQLGLALEGCVATSVVSDDANALRQAVLKLHGMGHRRIGHVTMQGAQDADARNPFRTAYFRCAGYQAAMRELGLEAQVFMPDENASAAMGLFESAVELCPKIQGAAAPATALTCFSDFTAAGLVAGLSDLGAKIPRDISIIGYGDQPFGRMLRPQLSTLAPQYERMGEYATEALLGMIEGKPAESIAVAPQLVWRDSVAHGR